MKILMIPCRMYTYYNKIFSDNYSKFTDKDLVWLDNFKNVIDDSDLANISDKKI